MGLYINHLDSVSFKGDRTLYIYLLDYGWPDGKWEQIFKRNFMKMADLASNTGSVVVSSPRGVHFGNEVLSFHRIGDLDVDKVLPGILITKTHPSYFEEIGAFEPAAKPGLEDMLVVPLSSFCTNEEDFIRTIEKVFEDLKGGCELHDFNIAEYDVRRLSERQVSSRIGQAIELKPGMFGFSVDLKKLLFG